MRREQHRLLVNPMNSVNEHHSLSEDDFEDYETESYSSEGEIDIELDDDDDTGLNVSKKGDRLRTPRNQSESYNTHTKKLVISNNECNNGKETSGKGVDSSYQKPVESLNSILVTYRDFDINAIRSNQLLYRQSLSIKQWIPILESMKTLYVKEGSCIRHDRIATWRALSDNDKDDIVEMYLVKWRDLSYIHCSWERESDLMEHEGPHLKQKLQRFTRMENEVVFELNAYGEDVFFNPDYLEVDRIMDVRVVVEDTAQELQLENNTSLESLLVEEEHGRCGQYVKEFLVKWKGIAYNELTWEVYDAFQNPTAIAEYYRHLNRDVSQYVNSPEFRPSLAKFEKVRNDVEYKEGNVLRSYQVEGINWLLWNWANGRNSILADEMGLGKTVQSSMFIYNIMHLYHVMPPFLVVAPLSTLPHWESEIRRWTDMHVVVFHGCVESRRNIKKYEWKSKRGEFDILLTTYEICIVESELLSSISWGGLVVDEAHRLKGKNNKLGDMLRKINFGCKLLLTGTPLQNNTEELWILLNFLQPERFDNMDQFQADFGDMKVASQLEKLHETLKPFMLRRMKEDVEKSLKPKEETVINVELTALQKKFYRAVYDHNTSVFIGTDGRNLPSLMNIMMELRKCCNHPFLIRGVEQTVVDEMYTMENIPRPEVMPTTMQDMSSDMLLKYMLCTSGKMVLLDKLLPKLQMQGHRVLLFSQMVRMLDIIQDYLALKGYTFERIDGGVKINDRQSAIDRFSAPGSDRFIFLICTRAGGFGINLTAADTVIIFDSDWNPQNDIQAQARCHRIGQEKAVNVYRLITNRTYEMEMFQRANMKLGLDKAVLNPMKQTISADGMSDMVKMSKSDAETLLKYGAYDFFKEEREGKTEELSNAFCEADIDQILEKNAKVITIDSRGGSSFSKASFVTDTSMEVDINDPNFWTKMVGLKEPTQEEIGPRVRRKVEYRMAHDGDDIEGQEAGFEDESDWIKTDRDVLVKLLLAYGWGHWEPICAQERMVKHPLSSIRTLSSAIIGQLAQLTLLLEDDGDMKKMGNSSTKAALRGKEAILHYVGTYDICRVLADSNQLAEQGSANDLCFPRHYPLLVRDSVWLHKMTRVCSRYLKHFSFLYHLHNDVAVFKIAIGMPVVLPKPRRAVMPTAWWGMEEDRDSLLGAVRHGWGNWRDICSDADYCFHQKGVIYMNQSVEEEEGFMEVEGEGDIDISPMSPHLAESQESVVSPSSSVKPDGTSIVIPEDAKLFPSTQLLMKRIRRLVDGMELAMSKGIQSTNLDFVVTTACSNTPKKQKKTTAPFVGQWVVKESKVLRNTILQWGLPVPPMTRAEYGCSNPLFSMNYLPLPKSVMDREKDMAVVCDVMDTLVRDVISLLSTTTSITQPTPIIIIGQALQSSRDVASPYPFHQCPLCALATEFNHCIFCDVFVYYRLLKVESCLLYKSYEDVQYMARYIEESAVKVCEIPNRVKLQAKIDKSFDEDPLNTPVMDTEVKIPSDIEVIIPSTVLAQRIHSRLQLYYDMLQLVWCKDVSVQRAFLQRWVNSGFHHQDNVPSGWSPMVHDVALFAGILHWGVVEWDVIWKDPDLPFFIADSDDSKKKTRKRGGKKCRGKTAKDDADSVEVGTEVDSAKEDNVCPTSPSRSSDGKLSYTLEDAIQKKSRQVNRKELVAGLPSLYVLKRVNAIIRFFKQWRSYAIITSINITLPESVVIARSKERQVVFSVGKSHYMFPIKVIVSEEVFWKRNQGSHPHSRQSRVVASADMTVPVGNSVHVNYFDLWQKSNGDGRTGNSFPQQNPIQNAMQNAIQNPVQSLGVHSRSTMFPLQCMAAPCGLPLYSTTPPLVGLSVAVKPMPSRDGIQIYKESRFVLQCTQFPLKVKGVIVHELGHIVTQWRTYHSSKYIWPVGFKSSKMCTSFKDPHTRVTYTSEILDGGPQGPEFRVVANDSPETPFISRSASSSWQQVLETVKAAKIRIGINKSSISISGPESFGFSYPEVATCIEGLDGAELCKDYVCRCLRTKVGVSGEKRDAELALSNSSKRMKEGDITSYF